jgi:hypothetical protein
MGLSMLVEGTGTGTEVEVFASFTWWHGAGGIISYRMNIICFQRKRWHHGIDGLRDW